MITFNSHFAVRIMSSKKRNPHFAETVIQIMLAEIKKNKATTFNRVMLFLMMQNEGVEENICHKGNAVNRGHENINLMGYLYL